MTTAANKRLAIIPANLLPVPTMLSRLAADSLGQLS